MDGCGKRESIEMFGKTEHVALGVRQWIEPALAVMNSRRRGT